MRIPPSSFSIFRRSKVLAFFFAVITISCPRGKQVSLSLKNSLMRRLSLFLLTALPVFLLTVSPNLVIPSPFSLRITLKCFVWWRWPDRFRLTKSDGFNILFRHIQNNPRLDITLITGNSYSPDFRSGFRPGIGCLNHRPRFQITKKLPGFFDHFFPG